LADQLKLIAAKLEHPGWQPAAVERAKAFAVSEYDGFAMSSLAVMQRDLQYLLSGRDARWKVQPPAAVKTLTPAQFRQFWEPLLASGPVEILLFGDFDRDAAVRAIEGTIGAMQPRRAAAVPAGADRFTFPAHTALPLKLAHKGPTDQAATIIAWPTGGGLESISEGRELEIVSALFRDRLFEKFRSQQAASYSPDSISNWPEEFANGGYLMAYSQVQPKDRERFFAFAREVAADLAAKPVSADELQRAVEPAKQYVERAMSGNIFWMNQIEGESYSPPRFSDPNRLYDDYARVTPQRIMELAKRYFRTDREWTMVIEPEGMR
jgi:zinc protease